MRIYILLLTVYCTSLFSTCYAVTFVLPAKATECFQFHSPANVVSYIDWSVERGGDLDVGLQVPQSMTFSLQLNFTRLLILMIVKFFQKNKEIKEKILLRLKKMDFTK